MNPSGSLATLDLLRTLAAAAAEAPSTEAGLQRVADAIREATGWPYGEVWIPDDAHEVLRCLYAAPGGSPEIAEFRRRAHELAFPRGQGLPGRVWATLQPIWHPDVTVLPPDEFARCHEAAEAGLEAGLGVPIADRDRLVAVLAFFAPLATEQDWEHADAVGIVAPQLGAFFGQRRLEQQLAAVRERLADTEQRLAALREGIAIHPSGGRRQLLTALASLARADLEADHTAVLLVNADGGVADHGYHGVDRRGADRLQLAVGGFRVPAAALQSERPLLLTTGAAAAVIPGVPGIELAGGSALVAAVPVDADTTALVCAVREPGKPPFADRDAARAEDLGVRINVGLTRFAALDMRTRATALEERLRVMTEIQDDIIQNLFGLGLQLDTLAAVASSGDTASAIASGLERVNDLIGEARRYLLAVASTEAVPDTDLARGLAALLHKRVPPTTAALLQIRADDLPALRREALGNILLIVREALDNAVQHADATRVALSLRRAPGGFELVVQDDGTGFDQRSTPGGPGMAAMAAAAARIGAQLAVFSIPGMGTTVHLTFAES